MSFTLLYVITVLFFATLVRSTFGFGESLIAVPLLLFLLPIEVTVPISVLMSIFIALFVVIQDHKQIDFKSAKWLILYAILGIPFGLLLLLYANNQSLKYILGIFIILYALYSLFSKQVLTIGRRDRVWRFICGFLSGILGGAFAANGPPLVVYGNLKQWKAQHFRATLQAYFLPVSTVTMCSYLYKGLWNIEVTEYFLCSVPLLIPAILLGRYLNRRFKSETFQKAVYVGLLLIGLLMFF